MINLRINYKQNHRGNSNTSIHFSLRNLKLLATISHFQILPTVELQENTAWDTIRTYLSFIRPVLYSGGRQHTYFIACLFIVVYNVKFSEIILTFILRNFKISLKILALTVFSVYWNFMTIFFFQMQLFINYLFWF